MSGHGSCWYLKNELELKIYLKWLSSVFVRFWGRSREELDFSLILQNQISGESGRELAENREEKAREREIQNLNFSVKFGVKYIFHKKIYLKSRCLTGVAVVE